MAKIPPHTSNLPRAEDEVRPSHRTSFVLGETTVLAAYQRIKKAALGNLEHARSISGFGILGAHQVKNLYTTTIMSTALREKVIPRAAVFYWFGAAATLVGDFDCTITNQFPNATAMHLLGDRYGVYKKTPPIRSCFATSPLLPNDSWGHCIYGWRPPLRREGM